MDMKRILESLVAEKYITCVAYPNEHWDIFYHVTRYRDHFISATLAKNGGGRWVLSDQGDSFGELFSNTGIDYADLSTTQRSYLTALMEKTHCRFENGAITYQVGTNPELDILNFPSVLAAMSYIFLVP